jgi:hypothetical protein
MRFFRRHARWAYLKPGRFEDIIALIQVLALDESVYRGESALERELSGKPRSAKTWLEITQQHSEFFCLGVKGDSAALVLRAYGDRDEKKKLSPLPKDDLHKIVGAASSIYAGQLSHRRVASGIWTAAVSGLFAAAASAATLVATLIAHNTR